MKISEIRIENFMGLANRSIMLDRPVTLVTGPNESGKTTVLDAIRLALLGEPGRVRLKKDYPALLTAGATSGRVTVVVDGHEVTRSVKDGTFPGASFQPPPHLELVMDALRFGALDSQDRRRVLFKITGASLTADAIANEIERRGLDLKRFESVRPMLRTGLEVVVKECQARASEARGGWKATTGETYGEKKAEGWRAPIVPPASPEELEKARLGVIDAEKTVADALEQLGGLRANLERRKQLEHTQAEAASLEKYRAALAGAREEQSRLQAELETARVAAHPPQGVIGPCPHCGAELEYRGGQFHAAARRTTIAPPVAAKSAAALEAKVAEMAAKVRQFERGVANAEAAQRLLGHHEIPDDISKLFAQTTQMLERQRQAMEAARAHLKRLEDRVRAASQASDKERAAEEHHRSVLAWVALAEALSPDGIPASQTTKAMEMFNGRISESARAAGWMPVSVRADMEIMRQDGIPYTLLSESAKWRADALLAEAVSHLAGLRALFLDRLDVLDLRHRGAALRWLHGLASQYDTIVVAGTLKERPAALPDTYRVVWLGEEAARREAA
jgi:hypothetical protein